jgi:hypothetical protein
VPTEAAPETERVETAADAAVTAPETAADAAWMAPAALSTGAWMGMSLTRSVADVVRLAVAVPVLRWSPAESATTLSTATFRRGTPTEPSAGRVIPPVPALEIEAMAPASATVSRPERRAYLYVLAPVFTASCLGPMK